MPLSPDPARHRHGAGRAPDPGRAGPGTFPSLLLASAAVLFALVTWQVVAGGPLVGADEAASRALLHPDRFSELLSGLGDAQVAVPVLLAAAVCAGVRRRAAGEARWWLPPLGAAAAMALVPVLVVPLKEWTGRPGTPAVPPAVGYYPSGHTATAVVAYGAATLLLHPLLASAVARRLLVACCAVLVLGVSYGLVRRGYHWPLDVVASWCLGILLLGPGWPGLSRSSRRRCAGTPGSRSGPS
ncbi:phosphatase PAP2 family protein [Streptomyces sp. MS06]|uniref:phosphatase PAP2 family protein n=1 Tax=Streptomyces sp. MS06 TaxID=3385974 RepID=UPI0039A13A75